MILKTVFDLQETFTQAHPSNILTISDRIKQTSYYVWLMWHLRVSWLWRLKSTSSGL